MSTRTLVSKATAA